MDGDKTDKHLSDVVFTNGLLESEDPSANNWIDEKIKGNKVNVN